MCPSVLRRRVIANRTVPAARPRRPRSTARHRISNRRPLPCWPAQQQPLTARAGALVVSRRHMAKAAAKSARASMIATSASALGRARVVQRWALHDCSERLQFRSRPRSAFTSARSRTSKRYLQLHEIQASSRRCLPVPLGTRFRTELFQLCCSSDAHTLRQSTGLASAGPSRRD